MVRSLMSSDIQSVQQCQSPITLLMVLECTLRVSLRAASRRDATFIGSPPSLASSAFTVDENASNLWKESMDTFSLFMYELWTWSQGTRFRHSQSSEGQRVCGACSKPLLNNRTIQVPLFVENPKASAGSPDFLLNFCVYSLSELM